MQHFLWRLKRLLFKTPEESYRADYENLIRLARRCAYDLRHTVQQLPSDDSFVTFFGMRERARHWVDLFAKGNPGKDYRTEQSREIDNLNMQLDRIYAWAEKEGLNPPMDQRIPF
jgi:hypothetical protein